jgi:hypothetical protein
MLGVVDGSLIVSRACCKGRVLKELGMLSTLFLVGFHSAHASDFMGNSRVDVHWNSQGSHAVEPLYDSVEKLRIDVLFYF